MFEQGLLCLLLALAMRAQLLGLGAGLRITTALPILLAAASTLVAQKVRSMADRQQDRDRCEGVTHARIECAAAQARWGAVLQALGLLTGIALAPTLWHVPLALYAALYAVAWRPVYRRWIKAAHDG